MRPLFSSPLVGETTPQPPSREEITLARFAAAAAAGETIALVVAKDPDAAAVYYFRDAMRAFSTYDRLDRMNSRPLVVTISAEGRLLGPVQVDGISASSAVGDSALGWFAVVLRHERSLDAAASSSSDAALALDQPTQAGAAARAATP
jgi:hypothetical protein